MKDLEPLVKSGTLSKTSQIKWALEMEFNPVVISAKAVFYSIGAMAIHTLYNLIK